VPVQGLFAEGGFEAFDESVLVGLARLDVSQRQTAEFTLMGDASPGNPDRCWAVEPAAFRVQVWGCCSSKRTRQSELSEVFTSRCRRRRPH
jgi:hypothetical protein